MKYSLPILFVTVVALFSACAHQPETAHKPLETAEQPPSRPEEAVEVPLSLTQENALAAAVFEKRVMDAGGEVAFIFEDNRPFAQCHASTIEQAPDGTLIAAWFAGTEEKHPDVGIWMSRRVDGAWLPPYLAAKVDETAHWNPVLFADAEADVYLFFKVGPEISHWRTYWMRSDDHGETWTEPTELVPGDEGGRGPVKNKPIILSDGSWLAGASTEYQRWEAFADRSTDRGQTWQRSADFEIDRQQFRGRGAIQPTFWESAPGQIHGLLRTSAGRAWRVDSSDYGVTWTPVYDSDLPNNNSSLDALLLEDGRLLLLLNPVGMNWGPRTPLSLAVSHDNGDTWDVIAHLEDDPIDTRHEYSYPALIQTKNGVAASYTWRRERVRVWMIPKTALAALL